MELEIDQIRALAADWLRWHLAAGVDGFVDDQPHDRFAEAEAEKEAKAARGPVIGNPTEQARSQSAVSAPSKAATRSAPKIVASAPTGQADELVERARNLAKAAPSIIELAAAMASFDGCALKSTAKSHVFRGGNPAAKLMLIGDAPEADDDRSGAAFSGPAGVLLDAMLKAIGLTREDVALGMAIPWRPPGNRPPTPHEIALCEPFLRRHVELVAPKLILSFGTLASALLAGTSGTLLKQRGQVSKISISDKESELIVTLPPAHLLRYPVQKRFAWQDLKRARDILNG
jgi:uracil-DNA glycosylase family 4